MIAGRKYWSKEKEKYFKEELVMTKEDNKDFKIPTKCWICDNNYVEIMLDEEIIVISPE